MREFLTLSVFGERRKVATISSVRKPISEQSNYQLVQLFPTMRLLVNPRDRNETAKNSFSKCALSGDEEI